MAYANAGDIGDVVMHKVEISPFSLSELRIATTPRRIMSGLHREEQDAPDPHARADVDDFAREVWGVVAPTPNSLDEEEE